MKKQLFWFVFLAALLVTGCAGCTVPAGEETDSGSLTIMTWNVHNLFDGEDNGYEYEEFLQASGWSAEKYLGRLNSISDAISRINPLPDIILLQEIESLTVLEDLAEAISDVSSGSYSWSHFAGNPGAAVGLGILSSYPLADIKTHSITINGDTTPRPVLETKVQTNDNVPDFIIFACHWKSKVGGDEITEHTRKASARVILRRIRELQESEPELGIIIAGDLNLTHDEFYRQNASRICALLPDDPYCAMLTQGIQKDYIVISRNIPPAPVHFPQETIVFYSPWMRELENGTYFYRNNWETIDHFLVSSQFFTDSGWEYQKTIVVNFPPFANANGIPVSYNTRTGLGISDHLPLVMTLIMSVKTDAD
ncbi:MAG: endonuclease/exonuclease/phosphatase family protein [Treponema sp.]|nr:endonuclease/exonuclease/phosphatase family protein [Treponema sp.]